MEQKTILIMQNWLQHLSHEVLHGALDYVADNNRKDIAIRRLPWIHEELQHACEEYQASGVIASVVNDGLYQTIKKSGWKCISTHIGLDCPGMPQVDANHFNTGQMAAEYFLSQGFDHYGFAGISRVAALRMRCDGFEKTIEKAGYSVEKYAFPVIIDFPENPQGLVEDWLKELPKPIAIYCSDDQVASDLIHKCKQMNIHVPDQVAVLGTEDAYALCRASHPEISSVHLPYGKIGYTACEKMINWIDKNQPPTSQIEIEPEYISTRTSTDTLAIGDLKLRKAVRILRENCVEKVSIKDVARECGVSLRVLQHKFKNQLGHSPLTELHQARISSVKKLLRETPFSLEEIADRCGYPNANYLCEHFKKMTEQTPGEYRRETQRILR